jgi:hypothetical protein
MRAGGAALASLLASLSMAALAAPPPRLPPVLTPLGPVQAPLPSAPDAAPARGGSVLGTPGVVPIAPEPRPDAITAEPLPVLTPPDPATVATPPAAPGPPSPPDPANSPNAALQPLGSAPPPAPAAPGAAPPAPAAPAAQAAPAPAPAPWVAEPTVVLRVLNKVTARTATLTGRVGDTLTYGTLAIVVRSCFARPPDRPANAAAFLDIGDASERLFNGWMLAAEPSFGLLEHPVYDIRVTACRS